MAIIKRLLVANRGEIARRVMRTAHDLGLQTVAVYSDADAASLHVREASTAVALGGTASSESYLRIDKLLAAAQASGADAIHPGYGFLSENADFAQSVVDAGLTWVGPPASAIRALGSKSACKALAKAQGVPLLGGYAGIDQGDVRFLAEAAALGFPIMVKACAGGGGRGMRLVNRIEDMAKALASARAEALAGFGNDELLIERALLNPRHVEVQVFADSLGHCIHLGERDCSVQRRNQKIIEETPSPAVNADLRARMGACAVALAQGSGYVGAGTVEFLLDGDEFFLMEMNTRLQVEHPVTEAVTGLDLVAWQLLVAQGQALPLTQEQVHLSGHAIEVRLCAEDEDFNPHTGDVLGLILPPHSAFALGQVRIDHALELRGVVSPHYDSMLGKVIAHGANREQAVARLCGALQATAIEGLPTNRMFLLTCLQHPVFALGQALVPFLVNHGDEVRESIKAQESALLPWAMTAWVAQRGQRGVNPLPCSLVRNLRVRHRGHRLDVPVVELGQGNLQLAIGDDEVLAHTHWLNPHAVQVRIGGVTHEVRVGAECQVQGLAYRFDDLSFEPPQRAPDPSAERHLLSPMNGKVVAVSTQVAQSVKAGDTLVIVEAMKLQHNVTAPRDGVVESVHVDIGQQVPPRHQLVSLALSSSA